MATTDQMRPGSARRFVKVVALALVAGVVGVLTSFTALTNSSRAVVLGAHNATVQPAFDGYATLDFGPVLPRMRLPTDRPFGLGVSIDLGDSEVASIDQLAARDAVILSHPQGEIQKVTSTLGNMALTSGLAGVGAGTLTALMIVVVWTSIGAERRAVLGSARPTRRQAVALVAGGATALASVGIIVGPVIEDPGDSNVTTWASLRSVVPSIKADPMLDTVELSQGAASRGGQALLEGAVKTYQESVTFYGKLAETARATPVRMPRAGELTALVVTDRHDNIGMDQVARAVADRADARMLFDLGDDSSVGGKWEDFSINSLAKAFKGFTVVAVAGNHDTGPFVRQQMRQSGFHVLDGKPVTINGIRFLGSSDPRSSGLTAGYNGNEADTIEAIHRQDEALKKAACADNAVAVVLVHSPTGGKETAASGCVDLVLSGHLHRQVGPTTLASPLRRSTTTLTTGTTGGAVYAFALGSKLRRPAQVTIVTFRDGFPVGLQPVDFGTGGAVTAQPYVELATHSPVPGFPSARPTIE